MFFSSSCHHTAVFTRSPQNFSHSSCRSVLYDDPDTSVSPRVLFSSSRSERSQSHKVVSLFVLWKTVQSGGHLSMLLFAVLLFMKVDDEDLYRGRKQACSQFSWSDKFSIGQSTSNWFN